MPTKLTAPYYQRKCAEMSQSLTIALEDWDIFNQELKEVIRCIREGDKKSVALPHAREASIKREDMLGRLRQINMELRKLGNP